MADNQNTPPQGLFRSLRQSVTEVRNPRMMQVSRLASHLEQSALPADLSRWMGNLRILMGVPINYLVPDETMLPLESVKFFYLDANWINAMLDGAFSIGRNLTSGGETQSHLLDTALQPVAEKGHSLAAASLRGRNLGLVGPPYMNLNRVTGLILRSSVVREYRGLGIAAYAKGHTPEDKDPQNLPILRMEQLGPDSDTLICLFQGDPIQVDVHEAPEALHYGLDKVSGTEALKKIYRFTRNGNEITFSREQVPLDLEKGNCLRKADRRVVKMQALAQMIAAAQQPPIAKVDSAIMGFQMTQGVGKVSFKQKGTEQ